MKEVVINTCFGGFSLSEKAMELYREKGGQTERYWHINRSDPILIEAVKELGDEANTTCSDLVICEIYDDYDYSIDEYDGAETLTLVINENHLRELIRKGNEDEIVKYVMGIY